MTRKYTSGILALAVSSLVMATCVDVRAASVRLVNGGFESPKVVGESFGTVPQGWFYFASGKETKVGLTTTKKRNGSQAVVFAALGTPDSYQGLAQKFPVEPGRRYEFSVYVINDAADPIVGEAYAQVSIEWQDSTGSEITRNWGPTWNFELSPLKWERVTVGAEAPDGAAVGVAVVTFFNKDAAGQGKFYLDDAAVKDVTEEE